MHHSEQSEINSDWLGERKNSQSTIKNRVNHQSIIPSEKSKSERGEINHKQSNQSTFQKHNQCLRNIGVSKTIAQTHTGFVTDLLLLLLMVIVVAIASAATSRRDVVNRWRRLLLRGLFIAAHVTIQNAHKVGPKVSNRGALDGRKFVDGTQCVLF